MPPKQERLTCTQCEESLCRSRFSLMQRPRKSRICEQCASDNVSDNVQVAPTLTCTRCLEPLERARFSPRQQQRAQRVCLHCTARTSASSTEVRATYRTCKVCTLTLPRHCFSARAVKCDGCTLQSRPDEETSAISLGPCDRSCQFCGTLRFQPEATTFCCQAGKYCVDFSTYFEQPTAALLRVFTPLQPSTPSHAAADTASSFSSTSRTYEEAEATIAEPSNISPNNDPSK